MTVNSATLTTGTVAEAMTPGILTCLPVTPLRVVAQMMATHRVHAIVVFGNEDLLLPWGVLSDLDLVGAIESHAPAGAVAASPVVTVTPGDSLLQAASLMREHSTSHLIVVADESSPLPIGVLSTLDIARVLATEAAPVSRGTASVCGERSQ
ncbi:MAG TPA: CBS domain-containing protein [Gaiellaceae bacterium]|nr:CBS domain-containing protein [Gaiellaceae bacterium]